MAEHREAFRDLLDRIGQPRAQRDGRGETPEERATSTQLALEEIGLPAIVRPASRSAAPAAASSRPRTRTASACAGLRASPTGQVMVEQCLVGWQEVEYEVMRDADDTCIAVCSMENVDPLGVHTGDSIVVAPVQTLTDQVHQRPPKRGTGDARSGWRWLQRPVRAVAGLHAVIEVNPRVSRSSALASKATGYPIARVAARIAGRCWRRSERRHRHYRRGVRAGARLRRREVAAVPVRQVPALHRRLGSQMKATGEVMAIDRTFGAALNKALRGLGRRAPGRSPRTAVAGDVRLPRRGLCRRRPRRRRRSAGRR